MGTKETNRDKERDRQTERQTNSQTNRQIDRQIDTDKERQTESERERERENRGILRPVAILDAEILNMMSTVNWNPFVGSTYVSGTATRDFSSLLCICFANNCNN